MVEGWYGQPFPQPLARTREYVKIIRDVLAREAPVTDAGPHYPLPYPGGTGLGKPLKSITHPLRADLPIILGAEGPKNVALAAEIADGWLPIFYAPKHEAMYRESLAEGFARPGARRGWDDFEVLAGAPVVVTDDVEAAADLIRPVLALYIGGMGAKDVNFHARVYERMGYEAEVAKIQELYLERPSGRCHRRGADRAHRGDGADRPEGEAPRRPRGLAGILRHQPADSAGPQHHARHGRTAALASRPADPTAALQSTTYRRPPWQHRSSTTPASRSSSPEVRQVSGLPSSTCCTASAPPSPCWTATIPRPS